MVLPGAKVMRMAKHDALRNAVIELRKAMNMNQTEFGKKLGVSPMAVSRWEAGTNDHPRECVVKMAVLSGKPATFWLFMNHIGLSKKDFRHFR
jgi:transcriptional regulator with XRE-family HTH domain